MAMDFISELTKLLKSDKAQFVYGLFKNWYVLAAGAAIAVTVNVLWGMGHNGTGSDGTEGSTLDKIYHEVKNVLDMIEELSKTCPAKIEDLGAFFDCIGL